MNSSNPKKVDIPTYSLVFLTWNSAVDIERTINSVLDQTYSDFEIVIVDNDSQDGTVSIIKEQYSQREDVRIVANASNLGFSRGINRGIKAAHGEYICCYNDDTYFPKDYLQTLNENVTSDAVWTTARINHRVSQESQTVRLLTGHRFPIPYVVDSLTGVADVNFIPGDGLIVPRKIYNNELDGQVFDPALPAKGEDLDLSLRLRNSGVSMKAVLDTYSTHPDEGFYSPTIINVLNHLKNISARFQAYRKNENGLLDPLSVLASSISIPTEIYFRTFPRETTAFQERTHLTDNL